MRTSNKAKRRLSLFKQQDGRCYWCKCDLVLAPDGKHSQRQPPNLATIDHLRDRFHPERQVAPKPNERRLVLACAACNNRRGAENQAAAGKEELRRRSRYYLRHLFSVAEIPDDQLAELQQAHDMGAL